MSVRPAPQGIHAQFLMLTGSRVGAGQQARGPAIIGCDPTTCRHVTKKPRVPRFCGHSPVRFGGASRACLIMSRECGGAALCASIVGHAAMGDSRGEWMPETDAV